jgi:hypothetical protein
MSDLISSLILLGFSEVEGSYQHKCKNNDLTLKVVSHENGGYTFQLVDSNEKIHCSTMIVYKPEDIAKALIELIDLPPFNNQ